MARNLHSSLCVRVGGRSVTLRIYDALKCLLVSKMAMMLHTATHLCVHLPPPYVEFVSSDVR